MDIETQPHIRGALEPFERLNIMKTSFAHITVAPTRGIVDFARSEPEELMYWRNELTLETIAMIGEYRDVLSKIVFFHTDNDGCVDGTDCPSLDASLRHALSVALKATRSACKTNHGQWAIRKLKTEWRSKRDQTANKT